MKDTPADESIKINDFDEVRTLLGPLDTNTRLIREVHGVNVLVREGSLRLLGAQENVATVRELLEAGLASIRAGGEISTAEIARRIRGDLPDGNGAAEAVRAPPRQTHRRRGAVKPRTAGQGRYLEAMREHEVVLAVGPAGTGKTYLAVAAALAAVRDGDARRLVLVRPAVEAGEKLGFLPGDFQAKVDPYLRPLHDAVQDLLDPGQRQRYLDSDMIETCPLAYMRGRTLTDSFIILDEAQNTTVQQMLMFLTRLGEGSRMVVTGDPTQIDLPRQVTSGLIDSVRRLRGVDGVGIIELTAEDVVRHPVVGRILKAYGATGSAPGSAPGRGRRRGGERE